MRAAFQKEADDWKIRHGGSYSYGSGETRPLYSDAENCDVTLKFVLTSLLVGDMVGNHNLELIARLMQSWDAFAREGEIKFQELKEWIFDPFLKVTNTPWKETKTQHHIQTSQNKIKEEFSDQEMCISASMKKDTIGQ